MFDKTITNSITSLTWPLLTEVLKHKINQNIFTSQANSCLSYIEDTLLVLYLYKATQFDCSLAPVMTLSWQPFNTITQT